RQWGSAAGCFLYEGTGLGISAAASAANPRGRVSVLHSLPEASSPVRQALADRSCDGTAPAVLDSSRTGGISGSLCEVSPGRVHGRLDAGIASPPGSDHWRKSR